MPRRVIRTTEGEKWKYIIDVGGMTYTDDEISNDLSVSISAGSSGFSVGQCCSATITGTLVYKSGEQIVKTNSQLILYCYKNDEQPLIYRWFVKSFSVENKALIHFSAVDVMAFVDNEYPMEGTVASHIAAATEVIHELCGAKVEISNPPFSQKKITNQSGWTIRTLLQYSSIYGAINWAAITNDGEFKIKVIDNSYTVNFSEDDHSKLTVGMIGPNIQQIRVSVSDMEDPYLEEGMTYDDFGIYYLSNKTNLKSNVLNLVCPFADEDIKHVGDLRNKIGDSYGTEFSCDNVKVSEIYPPYININFGGFNSGPDNPFTFILSNATYKFTTIGIFASMSGDTKSLSDTEYIGRTETELKTKVALNMGYKSGFISQENGIYWDDSAVQEMINSG